MSIEQPEKYRESQVENERALNLNIVSLNHCKTVDEMINFIEEASREGHIDTVMLGEYNFTVDEVLADLEKIKDLAKTKGMDIILAPRVPFNEEGYTASWGELQSRLKAANLNLEENPADAGDETIGIFVGKDGFTYAFPKVKFSRPVHRIPNTKIGVSICSEIGKIQPKDLDGIDILYNPSREADDGFLKFRMLQRYGGQPLTREIVAKLLLERDYYKALLDDSQYDPKDPEYIPESDSREAREQQFSEAVERTLQAASDPKASIYVKKTEEILQERGIPVIRCDGPSCTGLLNPTDDVEIEGLEYKDAYTRFSLKKEN